MHGFGFCHFVSLDEKDAPLLFQRMSNDNLRVDAQRYGISSRLIARPGVAIPDLAKLTIQKICRANDIGLNDLGGFVLSSRVAEVQHVAEETARSLEFGGKSKGIERACSGFPAATEAAVKMCQQLDRPVAVVTAEIISTNINWETADGNLSDHRRACGQAAALFGDGAAGVLIVPPRDSPRHEILDCWIDEVSDEKQLIQKIDVEESIDPWQQIRPGITGCMGMPGRRGFLLLRRAPAVLFDAIQRSLKVNAEFEREHDQNPTHVVPHQANGMIIQQLQQKLEETMKPAPTVWNFIGDAGNTVSASIPTAMSKAQTHLADRALTALPSVGAGGPGYRPDILSIGCVLTRTRLPT
jgi:3-oxoacyl-[acyl-carrier-protein] synthase III